MVYQLIYFFRGRGGGGSSGFHRGGRGRGANQGGNQGYRGRGGGRGGFQPGRPTANPKKEPLKFEGEYDFDKANEEFKEVLDKLQVLNCQKCQKHSMYPIVSNVQKVAKINKIHSKMIIFLITEKFTRVQKWERRG